MENNITTTTPNPEVNSTINALKSILLITLFFGTFLASTSSFLFKRYALSRQQQGNPTRNIKRIFSLISCFGAGVFLATCLLDLLPDSIESIKRAENRIGHALKFPLPAFSIAVGFLFVLMLEQAILYAHKKNWISNSEMERLLAHQDESGIISSTRSHPHEENNEATNNNPEEEDPHFHPETHSTFRVILLVFALSLHAVFEGLSIGMISDVPILLQIFLALLIHKTIVGFSLGVRLVQSRLQSPTIVLCCALFSAQVLIGGFLGLAIMHILNGRASIFLISGILQAVACGTFLYVTAFEILPHELDNSSNIPLKMLSLMLGFGLITAFIVIFPQDADQ